MAFFDLFNAATEAAPAPVAAEDLTIYVGGGPRITIPFAQAAGKTVSQVFTANAGPLGADPRRVARYIEEGRVISGDTPVVAGKTYSATANLDEKG